MKIYVLVPCFNEFRTIKKVIDNLLKIKLNIRIILIDDGSYDGTKEIIYNNLKKKVYRFVDLKKNHGKGYAINKAKKHVKDNGLVIIQDADLEYNPLDFYKLFKFYLKNNNIKVVYGSRFLNKNFIEIYKSFGGSLVRIFGNKFLTLFSNIINNQKITDAHTCYKAFDSNIFRKIKLKERGFSFCPEINTKISLLDLEIKELPIKYISRTKKMGKKIGIKDAYYAIKTLIKYRYFY